MNRYSVKLTVSDRSMNKGDLIKNFNAFSSWEALQLAIDEVKEIGFPVVHDIKVNNEPH